MDGYIGEIRAFGFNFQPQGWVECNGQSLSVSNNTALYSIIGNKFGGNNTSFNVPDLRQRAVAGTGQGPGLSPYQLGQQAGQKSVQLRIPEMPQHSHTWQTAQPAANTNTPQEGVLANILQTFEFKAFASAATNVTPLMAETVSSAGEGAAHENRQPFLSLGMFICAYGEYPQRP
ncbi:MAG: tail fiber protein [Idiomarina sp.]|nr:tail fiber protein [Idiomarina sp.]